MGRLLHVLFTKEYRNLRLRLIRTTGICIIVLAVNSLQADPPARPKSKSFRLSGLSTMSESPSPKRFHHSDGRRYATRVWVHPFGSPDCFLFHTHAEDAHRMVTDGEAQAVPDGKRVWRITLLHSIPINSRLGPPTPPTITSYMGQRYVYRPVVGLRDDGKVLVAATFKRLHADDRWAYNIAQRDCMTGRYKETERT